MTSSKPWCFIRDPLNQDTDGDALPDNVEVNELGTSPTIPAWADGGINGVLQVERWNDISGLRITDLVKSDRFGVNPDVIGYRNLSESPQDSDSVYGLRMRGTITAPTNGVYAFALTGDDSAQVWLSDTASPYGRKLLLDLRHYTDFRNLSDGSVPHCNS